MKVVSLIQTIMNFVFRSVFYDSINFPLAEWMPIQLCSSFLFVLIVSICSIINNAVYYGFYFQGTKLAFLDILIRYVLPTTVYTALFSVVPVIFARKRRFAR